MIKTFLICFLLSFGIGGIPMSINTYHNTKYMKKGCIIWLILSITSVIIGCLLIGE